MNFSRNFPDQFEEVNGRLLEAKKAVRERDRILSLMTSLDESLAKEKKELETLTAQLEEAKKRVEELEGLTWTAVWQKLIGNHEEELSEEAEKLAEGCEYLSPRVSFPRMRESSNSVRRGYPPMRV
ncbi:MAG: hypothetical protein DHS20C20_06590 [Ardenticatenaceae bacterium]|nr:MAG: hypothetical protein DHS20C20_06590 [Ardenticatenaceae bacterium]